MTRQTEPTQQQLHVRVSEGPGSVGMVLEGALDADAAPRLSQEFERLVREGRHDIELDLRAVTMISSAGVGSLIAGVGECRDEGGEVVVTAMSDVVQHVLEMLELVDYFTGVPQNG